MPSTDPVEAILRKLVPYLSLEGDKVRVYAYDAGESIVVPISPAEREYLVELGAALEGSARFLQEIREVLGPLLIVATPSGPAPASSGPPGDAGVGGALPRTDK